MTPTTRMTAPSASKDRATRSIKETKLSSAASAARGRIIREVSESTTTDDGCDGSNRWRCDSSLSSPLLRRRFRWLPHTDDAAQAEVRGGCVDRLGHARGGPVALAVARRA